MSDRVVVDLIDGTYELFRHFYGPGKKVSPEPGDRAAVRGVLGTVLRMLEDGSTHLAVATDHVIESFRNDLWPGYKTGEGIDAALWEQFHPLEDALEAMGVAVWRMKEFEADDGLAAGAALAEDDAGVKQVRIWTPDKDLAQSVRGDRVIQVDRRSGTVRNEVAVIEKFGVGPRSIPDWLALTGDSADGYPGLPGWGARTSATVLSRWSHIEDIPEDPERWDVRVRGAGGLAYTLRERRAEAELFKVLATLRRDAPVSADVEAMRWHRPDPAFVTMAEQLRAPGLPARAEKLAGDRA